MKTHTPQGQHPSTDPARSWLRKPRTAALALALAALVGAAQPASAANSGIYGGGPLYINASSKIAELKNSGLEEVIVWNIFVNSNGDLNFNGEFLICSNGSYVGASTHSDFASNMAQLKEGTVKRISFCVGSSVVGVFQNIRDLINSQGTGSGSILYRNFQALKAAIPSLDAIDFDDENCFDQSTMVKFAVMLGNLGYKVSLCPYNNSSFWTTVASQTNSQRAGTIDRVHLQCYDGGAGNNPGSWNFGGIPVYPGLWKNVDSASTVKTKLTNWRLSANISGAFMWLYDDMVGNTAPYVNAMNDALTTVGFYQDANYSGTAKALTPGSYTHNQLISAGIPNDSLTALRVPAGLNVTIYENDNFGGSSWTFTSDTSNVGTAANDKMSSCIVTLATGTYKVLNRNSGFAIDATGGGTSNGTLLQQWVHSGGGGTNQHWTVSHIGNGKYRFIGQGSGRAVDVPSSSLDNSVQLQLWDWNNTGAQKWTLNYKSGGYFEAVNETSGKAMDVRSSSTANGAVVQQYTPNGSNAQQWIFITP